MSAGDRKLAHGISVAEAGKAKNIKQAAEMTHGEYSVYPDRLIKRGILAANGHGYVEFTLPLFEEFVKRK